MLNDLYTFVQSIRTRYWLGMLSAIDVATMDLARGRATQRRDTPFTPGSEVEFMRFLAAARAYLMAEGAQRPAGMDDEQFALLKPLCEHLVSSGRFQPDRLGLFAGLEKWAMYPQGDPQSPDQPWQRG